MADPTSNTMRPLCVDLDGTLIATQTHWESLALLLRREPAAGLLIPFWLLKGRAHLKRQMALRGGVPEPATLPYRAPVLAFVREEFARGRRVILATGADDNVARAIAAHLGCFTQVIASDGAVNRTGERKVQAIRAALGPDTAFDYLGDGRIDMPAFRAAQDALLVERQADVAIRLRNEGKAAARVFTCPCPGPAELLRLMRPNQWAKNLLLAVPLLVGHGHQSVPQPLGQNLLDLLLAFVTFSLAASSVYVSNDLLDAESDRRHPRKRYRPIAAGRVSMPAAVVLANLLAAAALLVAWWTLGPAYALMLLLYVALSASYTVVFKRRLLMDVIVLAGLYTHRILAGGVALSVPISPWLLAFAMFLFLSLAFVKRYGELVLMRQTQQPAAHGRGYLVGDIDILRAVGPASGYMAVLVFCLYIAESVTADELYRHSELLWGICPILLYWITRLWFLAERQAISDDPLLFALRDRVSYAVGLLILAIVLLAKLAWW